MAKVNMESLFIDAVAEIIDPDTGRLAGMVYQWNTGERRKSWTGTKLKTYKLRPLDNQEITGNLK